MKMIESIKPLFPKGKGRKKKVNYSLETSNETFLKLRKSDSCRSPRGQQRRKRQNQTD